MPSVLAIVSKGIGAASFAKRAAKRLATENDFFLADIASFALPAPPAQAHQSCAACLAASCTRRCEPMTGSSVLSHNGNNRTQHPRIERTKQPHNRADRCDHFNDRIE